MSTNLSPRGNISTWLITALVGINLLMAVLLAYSLYQSHEHYESQAELQTQNVANALNQNISSAVTRIELALLAVADELEKQLAQGRTDPQVMQQVMGRYENRVPEIEAIRIADATGAVFLGKGVDANTHSSWSDRDYFKHHRDHQDRSLQVTKPILGRVAKKPIIGFSIRYNYPDGRFGGVISAPVAVSYFQSLLAELALGPNGTLILRDTDLALITRVPPLPDEPAGQLGSISTSKQLHHFISAGTPKATYQTPSSTDGYRRTTTFARMDKVPMVVIAGAAELDYLAGWYQEVIKNVGLLCGFMLLSGLIVRFLLKQQAESEARGQALVEQEARLRTLVEAVPDSVQFKDGEGRWLVANSVCLQGLNLPPEGWQGKTDAELAALYPLLKERLIDSAEDDEQAWQDRQAFHSEDLMFESDGTPRYLDMIRVPLFDEHGQRHALVVVGRDVTERTLARAELEDHRRHLEQMVEERSAALMETEARASHIIEATADGLYGVDPQGLITFMNPAACQMLGYGEQETIGHHCHDLLQARQADGSPFTWEQSTIGLALRLGQPHRTDQEVYWRADGQVLPIMHAIHPLLKEGIAQGGVVSFVDISVQRAAAEAREQALNAAEHLARIKSEFLANMSHEIRTPLNGVLGFAEIGQRQYQNPEKTKDAFDKILRSGKRLLGVINDILDFSKIEAGKLSIDHSPVCLREVIEQALENVHELAHGKGLKLQAELADTVPEYCLGDGLRLGQVLLNLLSNAVKFTLKGEVTLKAALTPAGISFSVIDTGIGIPPETLPQLFSPFEQGDSSSTRRFGGTGLGLAICKHLVQLMGGQISATSTPGTGTTVAFHIPYHPVTPPAASQETSPDSKPLSTDLPLAGLRILVAEDDPINQEILAENLREDGAQVTVANNGLEAVAKFQQMGRQALDVVLMDLQMPQMDGYTAARLIHADAPNLPIIAQTAHAFSEERERCAAIGMAAHIAKPIDPDALTSLILKVVGRTPAP